MLVWNRRDRRAIRFGFGSLAPPDPPPPLRPPRELDLTCVIDGLPETHSTRAFAQKHGGVCLNFFNENQRGSTNWDHHSRIVTVNLTEALDASRMAVRD